VRSGWTSPGRYALATVVDRQRRRFAVETDVERADVTLNGEASGPAFTVTREAAAAGIRGLVITTERYDHRRVQAFLRTWIYHDRGLRDLAWPPVVGGGGVLALALLVAVPQDAA